MPDARKTLALPLGIALLAALSLGWTLTRDDDAPAGSTSYGSGEVREQGPGGEPGARRERRDPLALGEVDAPVVMVSYSDFQCPFCGKFARDTEPRLIDKYVDRGVLRIEWRDFPYIGRESVTAATGGRAAAAQGRFWEFHDAMYADQLPPNSGNLDEEYLAAVAEEAGLDVEQFRDDLARPDLRGEIQEDFRQGQQLGVTGTPAFVVNGQLVVGAQPTATFEQVIEEAAEDAS